jgi:hypothetical protein
MIQGLKRKIEAGSGAMALPCALALALAAPAFAGGVGGTVNEVCRTSSDAAFRAKYCQAAKDSQKGYVANKSTSAIWGGVSVVCLAACAKVATAASPICKYSQIGGSVADGAITKKFVDSITGSAPTAADAFKKKDGVDASSLAKSQGGTRFDGDACLTAANTAKKSFDKKADAQKNVDGLNQLRDDTFAMNTGPKDKSPEFEGGDGRNSGAATGGASDACGEQALKTALGSIRCAAKTDPSLPAYVKSEKFIRDLERASGKSADEFFAGFDNPAEALLDSPAGAALSADAKAGIAESLLAMEKRSDSRVAAKDSEGYRPGSGKTKASGDGETGFDVNDAIANVLGQMNGEAKEEADSGVTSVTAGRAPAATAVDPEDRTISIFDRVKWRYGAISAREQLGAIAPGGGER